MRIRIDGRKIKSERIKSVRYKMRSGQVDENHLANIMKKFICKSSLQKPYEKSIVISYEQNMNFVLING